MILYYYKRRRILTNNEEDFFRKLYPIATRYNLLLFSKIRVADIIEPNNMEKNSEWYSAFGRIKSRHVDFALVNPYTMQVIIVIELDDRSHNQPKTMERDYMINQAYQTAGICILRIFNTNQQEIERRIEELLGKPIYNYPNR